VPAEVLKPRNTWSSPGEYDVQAVKLARMFADNFKTFESGVTPEVLAAGPKA
jgi:phosphoenolpyruvate carboxykinase (ATP)